MCTRKLARLSCYFVFLSLLAASIQGQTAGTNEPSKETSKTKQADELARVGIIPFEDRTGTDNFRYMTESLADAINDSMLKEFSYNRIDPDELKKAVFEAEQEIIKASLSEKKSDSKDKKDENPEDKKQLELIKKAAKKINSDIVIFGNYSFDNEANEIIIRLSIYLALSDSVRTIEAVRNPVDNTIFKATENVSKSLVAEIRKMIEEATQKNKEKKTDEKVAENTSKEISNKPQEKMALTKKIAMADPMDWASKKFAFSLVPGFFINNDLGQGCGTCQLQVALNGRYWLSPNWFLGASADIGGINRLVMPYFEPTLPWLSIDALVFGGFGLPLGRFLVSADLGLGYYFIIGNQSGSVYMNPIISARVSGEFLLTEFLAIGVSIRFNTLIDIPTPVLFGGAELSLSFTL